MVDLEFGGDDEIVCEGCGTALPAFLDDCPYCDDDDDTDNSLTLPCPECGTAIHEDSQQCPSCGAWVTMKLGANRSGKGPKVFVLFLIGLAVLVLLRRLFF